MYLKQFPVAAMAAAVILTGCGETTTITPITPITTITPTSTVPTNVATATPTTAMTATPTTAMTATPTTAMTATPTTVMTATPTTVMTATPTTVMTATPTTVMTATPTTAMTATPTTAMTATPTTAMTATPTTAMTATPTTVMTATPTTVMTATPTTVMTAIPTTAMTATPTTVMTATPTTVMTATPTPTPTAVVTADAKNLFDANCAVCHNDVDQYQGANGSTPQTFDSLSSLVSKIANTMPLYNSGACDTECAETIGAALESQLVVVNATATPSPTAVMTATPTATMTATPTATMTATPTATMTATPTATMTATPTATMTATPTATMTATPTAAMTATPTIMPTAQPIVGEPAFPVIGYFADWEGTDVNALPWDKLTHINYSFGLPDANGRLVLSNPQLITDLVALAHLNGVKISLAIGGWDLTSDGQDNGGDDTYFYNMAKDSTKRAQFISDVMSAVETYGLDGVDMDWEYPDNQIGLSGAKQSVSDEASSFETLIVELAEKLHFKGKTLSSAAVANAASAGSLGFTANTIAALDYINVMSYDMAAGNHADLDGSKVALQSWLTKGVPADKLIYGVPFYGRTGSYWGAADAGYSSFKALESQGASKNENTYVDSTNRTWYYDGVHNLQAKTVHAGNVARGVMIWEISQDNADNDLVNAIVDARAGTIYPTLTPTMVVTPTPTATAVPTATPTPTPEVNPCDTETCVDASGISEWVAQEYTGGIKVTYQDYVYESSWWPLPTASDIPGASQAWKLLGRVMPVGAETVKAVDNHIEDSDTNLMWTSTAYKGASGKGHHAESKLECDSLTLDGYSDWRMPLIDEALTLPVKLLGNVFTHTYPSHFPAGATSAKVCQVGSNYGGIIAYQHTGVTNITGAFCVRGTPSNLPARPAAIESTCHLSTATEADPMPYQ